MRLGQTKSENYFARILMIHGYLKESSQYIELLRAEIWREAFAAIACLTPDSPLGITQLRGPHLYINVHTYETAQEDACNWESHRHTIDLQYIISGSEGIGLAQLQDLGAPTGYREEKDTLSYQQRAADSLLLLKPGGWAIFFPRDPHKPKIASGIDTRVLKAVVKIDESLLA